MSFPLTTNQTADEDSDNIFGPGDNFGGQYHIKITGVFDGASLQIQIDYGDDDFVNDSSGSFNQGDIVPIGLKVGERLKTVISGAGGSTSITVKIL